MKKIEYTTDVPLIGSEPVQFIVTDKDGNQLLVTCELVKKAATDTQVVVQPATTFALPAEAEQMRQQVQPIADTLAKKDIALLRSSGTAAYLALLSKLGKDSFVALRNRPGYEVETQLGLFIDGQDNRLYAYAAVAVACHMASIEAGAGGIIAGTIPAFS